MKKNKCVANMRKSREGRWFECTSKTASDCQFNERSPYLCPYRISSSGIIHCGCRDAQILACSNPPISVIADCPECSGKMPLYTEVCPGGRWYQYRCVCGYESDRVMS